ncbi:hypothetical protein GUITHDRAFT_153282 [Guillardia theta CCMP2712]|uniref:Uncharacterized protein n=1 Tax=Guillardia theta (strain CCMP2712) TaxID=905079 RepID=L1J5V8_GUITC|nr:hypothetical protein GUITHDRAFT_153282 [Guillardia theta CCMP2712]EKX43504.1 hypothetical protein GUITHDRAFT_153282 [Guillardia theta CCMP2712]|eukprot:XP_005830484.1 hypothetical protein GUITHDRAFT_153282 [Guillardia theta CCMP2712]
MAGSRARYRMEELLRSSNMIKVPRWLTMRARERLAVSSETSRCRLGGARGFMTEGGMKGHTDEKEDPMVRNAWIATLTCTSAMFGGGIALGYNTLLPAWATFHAGGVVACSLKKQPFEIAMHALIFSGVMLYWTGYWGGETSQQRAIGKNGEEDDR